MCPSDRAAHEIAHGRWLAEHDAEQVWGWGSPAGQRRAARRGELLVAAAGIAAHGSASRARAPHRILEVGCGGGLFTECFANAGANVLAVELSPELVELAEQRGLDPHRVRFVCGRFEDVPLPGDGSEPGAEQVSTPGEAANAFTAPFDAVVGSSVLHHLELEPALRRIHALLRPSGRLVFAEPNMLNPQVWMERRFRHWDRFRYVSPDETAFVRRTLARDLRAHGFDDVRITPFDWLHPSTPAALIPMVSGVGRILEGLPGVREFAGSLLISARRAPETHASTARRAGGPA